MYYPLNGLIRIPQETPYWNTMDRILKRLEAMEGLLTVQRAAELLVHHPQPLYPGL
jgi:hypothetical protein